MDSLALKRQLAERIDTHAEELDDLALRIHARPEVAFEERYAATTLADYLESSGARVVRGVAGLETALLAEHGQGEPVVALLAEYDALPEIGHACGHNLIAAAAVGAYLALREVGGVGGRVRLVGCPAEEYGDGKIALLHGGVFSDVTAALMIHPGDRDESEPVTLAMTTLDVMFSGRSAHAASEPHAGVNALDAVVLAWNALGALRLAIRSDSRVHGVILEAGTAANVIPERSAARLMVRSPDSAYLTELRSRVLSCFQGAAKATGCDLSYSWSASCEAVRTNGPLAAAFTANAVSLGRSMPARLEAAHGSTDMGNVTMAVPGIHPFVAIVDTPTPAHSHAFAAAAATPEAMESMRFAAKALAMTALDVLHDAELTRRVWEAFRER